MPSMDTGSSYEARCKMLKLRRAKLIAKGLDPRGMKFLKLMCRR